MMEEDIKVNELEEQPLVVKRSLFSELKEGMLALKEYREGRITLESIKVCSKYKIEKSEIYTCEKILSLGQEIHNNRYVYHLEENKVYGNKDKIEIECSEHGVFKQKIYYHFKDHCGCQKCSNSISSKEVAWLDFLEIEEENRQKLVAGVSGKKYSVDALKNNMVHEFVGDFWHRKSRKI